MTPSGEHLLLHSQRKMVQYDFFQTLKNLISKLNVSPIQFQKPKKFYLSLKDLNIPHHYIWTWETTILGSAQTRAIFAQLYYHGVSINTNDYQWRYVNPWEFFRGK